MGSLGPTTVSVPKSAAAPMAKTNGEQPCDRTDQYGGSYFRMPLHYPRYKKADYETMPEWRLDCLLREYGLPVAGDVESKRSFAMGAFLWPDQY